ncbi:MAG: hypothetical protein HY301_18640, partial [Verrucomicrobia bacterium]|nr:hypothetical protein [Verrucomicrobiota bacterium]
EGLQAQPINAATNSDAWYNSVPPLMSVRTLVQWTQAASAPGPGSRTIFSCPTTKTNPTPSPPTMAAPFFMLGFNDRMDPNGGSRFRITELLNPAATVIFSENNESTFPSTTGRFCPPRHAGNTGANIAFGDGHAELTKTNDYSRTTAEDNSSTVEWAIANRAVYWYPYSGAPK